MSSARMKRMLGLAADSSAPLTIANQAIKTDGQKKAQNVPNAAKKNRGASRDARNVVRAAPICSCFFVAIMLERFPAGLISDFLRELRSTLWPIGPGLGGPDFHVAKTGKLTRHHEAEVRLLRPDQRMRTRQRTAVDRRHQFVSDDFNDHGFPFASVDRQRDFAKGHRFVRPGVIMIVFLR